MFGWRLDEVDQASGCRALGHPAADQTAAAIVDPHLHRLRSIRRQLARAPLGLAAAGEVQDLSGVVNPHAPAPFARNDIDDPWHVVPLRYAELGLPNAALGKGFTAALTLFATKYFQGLAFCLSFHKMI